MKIKQLSHSFTSFGQAGWPTLWVRTAVGVLSCFVFLCIWSRAEASILLEAGPEIYQMRRWRNGGTEQSGRIDGIRFDIERLKGNAWYIGFDALLANGHLKGRSGSGRSLSSEITDLIYEGRVGYTFQNCISRKPFITPYGGYGRFEEKNAFQIPSPIAFTFTDTFNYICAGFLSGVNFTPLLSMGLNFEVRFMIDGKSEVTNDPLFNEVTLIMNNETHFRVEVPLTYQLCGPCGRLEAYLVPFYEFRHFGGREGFPFDYIDTKFSLVGARLAIGYKF